MLKQLNAIKEAQSQMQQGNATAIAMQVQIWYDPVLIPNDIPVSKITKFSDVTKLGGKILRQQYFNLVSRESGINKCVAFFMALTPLTPQYRLFRNYPDGDMPTSSAQSRVSM